MTPSDLSQILSRCASRFSHFIGFNDSVSCKSVSYKNCLRVILIIIIIIKLFTVDCTVATS